MTGKTTTLMAAISQVLLLLAITFPIAAKATWTNGNDLVELTDYHVTTNVESRLLKTTIDMTFLRLPVAVADDGTNNTTTSGPHECGPVIHTMTLQLPRLARVQSLEMDLSNGCQLGSEVQGLEQAKDTFDNSVSQGKPAALLTAWDMSNYKLQIVLPPPGSMISDSNTTNVTLVQEPKPTTVRLTYTELLVQKNHRVDFQLPLFPGVTVSKMLQLDLNVQDTSAGVLELNLNQAPVSFQVTQPNSKLAMAHFEQSNLPYHSSIPRLVRGFFKPAALPDTGAFSLPLIENGKEEVCFTHVFNPSDFLQSAGSLPKNIVFVIDTSGSMSGERLANAKVAFASMVNALVDEKDSFRVQTFATQGTKVVWEPRVASASAKESAIKLVQSLSTDGGTNLHDAYMDGIKSTSPWMHYDIGTAKEAVPILVVLSDGEASSGITDRSAIATNVKEANTGGKVKIFSLAFGESADVDLLTGIALQNGGKVLQIYEGYGDTVEQMEDFYQTELEEIALSDIDISYFRNAAEPAVGVASTAFLPPLSILDATSSKFPTLAGGSECVVRGKISKSELMATNSTVRASISALSAVGTQDWSQQYDLSLPLLDDEDNPAPTPLIANDCEQSFAHARIEELLTFRSAQRALGDSLTSSSGSALEEQARKIAIEAQLVWPGLTGLVTVENPDCKPVTTQSEGTEEQEQVCYSGESSSGEGGGYDGDEGYQSTSGTGGAGGGYGGGSFRSYSGAARIVFSWWFIATFSSIVVGLLY